MRLFTTQSQLDAAMGLPPLNPGAYRFTKAYGPAGFVCADCNVAKPFPLGLGTGYARCDDKPDGLVCYACCGVRDEKHMRETGEAVLYLTASNEVSNWPETLKLPAVVRRGRHNIARYRYDVWFWFEGAKWYGVQIGENTQIIRCRRLKKQKRA